MSYFYIRYSFKRILLAQLKILIPNTISLFINLSRKESSGNRSILFDTLLSLSLILMIISPYQSSDLNIPVITIGYVNKINTESIRKNTIKDKIELSKLNSFIISVVDSINSS